MVAHSSTWLLLLVGLVSSLFVIAADARSATTRRDHKKRSLRRGSQQAATASATEENPPRRLTPAVFDKERYLQENGSYNVDDQYLVQFSKGVLPSEEFDAAVAELGGERATHLDLPIIRLYVVNNMPAEITPAQVISALTLVYGVEDVQQDDIMLTDNADAEIQVEVDELEKVADAFESQDDPDLASYYRYQWNMAAINAKPAWDAGVVGSSDIKIAVLDSGIDYLNKDLNGRVDLGLSKSFVDEDDLVAEHFPDRDPITDLGYHGTFVASQISSNAVRLAGVTSKTTLLAVKVCSGALGGCPVSSVLAGLLHAVTSGADVANLSIGGYYSRSDNQGEQYIPMIHDAFAYARKMGMTVVVSAGNSAVNLHPRFGETDTYKAYCSTMNTICVAATGPASNGGSKITGPFYDVDSAATDYSNYGRYRIDFSAPGGTSQGLVIGWCSQTSLDANKAACQTRDKFLGASGTSMATAHVSGLAALVVQKVGRDPGKVWRHMRSGADMLTDDQHDEYFGVGRINVGETMGVEDEDVV